MSRYPGTSIQPRDPRHGDHEASKMAVLRPSHVQNRPEEINDYQEEQNSRPSTPAMTNGSSRSTSIITCYTCGMSGNHCTCLSSSDSDNVRVFSQEDWTRSPHSSPALLARQGKGNVFPQASGNRQLGLRHPYLKLTGKASIRIYPRSDDNLDELDSEVNPSLGIDSATNEQDSPSHISNDPVLLHSSIRREIPVSANTMLSLTSDSEADDDEDDSDDSDEGDEDDDWSGQDSNLEAIILKAVGDDLALAAHLIPILHNSLRSEFVINAKEKLGSWRNGVIKSAQGGGSGGEQSAANFKNDRTSSSRKRQRHQNSANQDRKADDFEDEDEDEDDDPQGFKSVQDDPETEELPRLACPFHKHDPIKYGIQHGDVEGSRKAEYRTCAGPGFKSIQRLKEHLRRKHYPVQCDRCYHIFVGSDRAQCILELQSHRQLPDPCERRSPSGKEGISDAQWVNLDKKKSSRKSQVTSRVALWMEYWVVLFPGSPPPATPWYDDKISSRAARPTSDDVRGFALFFRPMLNLKVSQQRIRFLEGSEDVMKSRVEDLVYQAFSLYLGLNGSPSTTNSSSSRSGQERSLLGGSFQHLFSPTGRTSRGQNSSSNSRSTAAPSQAYSMDVASSPMAVSMAPHSLSQGHSTSMAPPYSTISRMSVQNFAPNTLQPPMPNAQSYHSGYHSNISNSLNDFPDDPFVNDSLGSGESSWQIFNNSTASFFANQPTSNLSPANYVNLSQSPLDQTLLDSSEDNDHNRADLRGFDQYQSPGNLGYSGTQQ